MNSLLPHSLETPEGREKQSSSSRTILSLKMMEEGGRGGRGLLSVIY